MRVHGNYSPCFIIRNWLYSKDLDKTDFGNIYHTLQTGIQYLLLYCYSITEVLHRNIQ